MTKEHWGGVQGRENVTMLTTVVSSGMLAAMSREEGFRTAETLTGFKWLGNWSNRYAPRPNAFTNCIAWPSAQTFAAWACRMAVSSEDELDVAEKRHSTGWPCTEQDYSWRMISNVLNRVSCE